VVNGGHALLLLNALIAGTQLPFVSTQQSTQQQTQPLTTMPTKQTMTMTTHTARITGPVTYVAANGRRVSIPLGPCMVESMDGALTDIIWGTRGQSSAALPSEEVQAAQDDGHLVLLD
jgi:hypothetical protein